MSIYIYTCVWTQVQSKLVRVNPTLLPAKTSIVRALQQDLFGPPNFRAPENLHRIPSHPGHISGSPDPDTTRPATALGIVRQHRADGYATPGFPADGPGPVRRTRSRSPAGRHDLARNRSKSPPKQHVDSRGRALSAYNHDMHSAYKNNGSVTAGEADSIAVKTAGGWRGGDDTRMRNELLRLVNDAVTRQGAPKDLGRVHGRAPVRRFGGRPKSPRK